jgi:hypothetical protein
VATGTNGLVSDFAGQALTTYAVDGRTSETWQIFQPATATGTLTLSSDSTGPFMDCLLKDINSDCAVNMGPRCYDARAYTGVEFRFKGGPSSTTGQQAIFALETLATVPPSDGGNCMLGANCYDTFHVTVTLTPSWTGVVRFPFSSFAQSGFGPAPPGYIPQSELIGVAFGPVCTPLPTGCVATADIDAANISFY